MTAAETETPQTTDYELAQKAARNDMGAFEELYQRHNRRVYSLCLRMTGNVSEAEDLAQEVGLSRSAFHERFVQYLGQPPMQYLASWRIQLGARLLRESGRVVASIALEVGYESEAAFSRAFKRMVGMPPAAWRKAHATE